MAQIGLHAFAGSRTADFCSWFWCTWCAIAQEYRTVEYNDIYNGVWPEGEEAESFHPKIAPDLQSMA